ncbi:MAG: CBS domain-containing protein [Alphaproteobacteria bacterium]|nr:CBS domain-containing protein [Alphaproteobacteria bacterium]
MTSAPTLPDLEPYRRRVSAVMHEAISDIAETAPLAEIARRMGDNSHGGFLVRNRFGQHVGILTERDVLRALGREDAAALRLTAADLMTREIVAIHESAFVFRAIGRMRRLNLRYLPVTDNAGRFIGMLTARALLRLRAQDSQLIADELDIARTAEELGHARTALPQLAATLLAEGSDATAVAAVISGIYADITARAAAIVEAEFNAAGDPAPAPWCMLILGSGGRGESLLKPDQDNAIIHAGSSEDDGWYARIAERINALLDAAGVPFCKGGVMAKNTAWRGAQGQWRARVTEWIGRHTPEALLNVDIFFDLQPVYGALRLGEALRFEALAAARSSPVFLRQLAEQTAQLHPALGFFGRLKTDDDGRIDLKLGGLLPVVSAARLMALKLGVAATGTVERLQAVGAAGLIGESDIAGLTAAHALLLELILRQQIADLEAGQPPGSRIDPSRLTALQHSRLKAALKHVALLPEMVQDVLTAAPAGAEA